MNRATTECQAGFEINRAFGRNGHRGMSPVSGCCFAICVLLIVFCCLLSVDLTASEWIDPEGCPGSLVIAGGVCRTRFCATGWRRKCSTGCCTDSFRPGRRFRSQQGVSGGLACCGGRVSHAGSHTRQQRRGLRLVLRSPERNHRRLVFRRITVTNRRGVRRDSVRDGIAGARRGRWRYLGRRGDSVAINDCFRKFSSGAETRLRPAAGRGDRSTLRRSESAASAGAGAEFPSGPLRNRSR